MNYIIHTKGAVESIESMKEFLSDNMNYIIQTKRERLPNNMMPQSSYMVTVKSLLPKKSQVADTVVSIVPEPPPNNSHPGLPLVEYLHCTMM